MHSSFIRLKGCIPLVEDSIEFVGSYTINNKKNHFGIGMTAQINLIDELFFIVEIDNFQFKDFLLSGKLRYNIFVIELGYLLSNNKVLFAFGFTEKYGSITIGGSISSAKKEKRLAKKLLKKKSGNLRENDREKYIPRRSEQVRLPNMLIDDDQQSIVSSAGGFLFAHKSLKDLNQEAKSKNIKNTKQFCASSSAITGQNIASDSVFSVQKRKKSFVVRPYTSFQDTPFKLNEVMSQAHVIQGLSGLSHLNQKKALDHGFFQKLLTLNCQVSEYYVNLLENSLKARRAELDLLQCKNAALFSKNFTSQNIKMVEKRFASYNFPIEMPEEKKKELLKIKMPCSDTYIQRFRVGYLNTKFLTFLSFVEKSREKGCKVYLSEKQFAIDMYAFQVLNFMLNVDKNFHATLMKKKKDADFSSMQGVFSNFKDLKNKLEEAVNAQDKFAKYWLAMFIEYENKNQSEFLEKVMNMCKNIFILWNLLKIQDQEPLNFPQFETKALEILYADFDAGKFDFMNLIEEDDQLILDKNNLYHNFLLIKDLNQILLNKKKLEKKKDFKGIFQRLLPDKPEDEINKENFQILLRGKSEDEIKNIFEQLKKMQQSNSEKETIKVLNNIFTIDSNSEYLFNMKTRIENLKIYYATYKMLQCSNNNEKKTNLKKILEEVQLELISPHETSKQSRQVKNEVFAFSNGFSQKLSTLGSADMFEELDRNLTSDDYRNTAMARGSTLKGILRHMSLTTYPYQGFQLEDFMIGFLNVENSFLNKKRRNDSVDVLFANCKFDEMYLDTIKKIEKNMKILRDLILDDDYESGKKIVRKMLEEPYRFKKELNKTVEHYRYMYGGHPALVLAAEDQIRKVNYVKEQLKIVQNFIELIEKTIGEKKVYKGMILNILIYPDIAKFASDWPFLVENEKKSKLSESILSLKEIFRGMDTQILKFFQLFDNKEEIKDMLIKIGAIKDKVLSCTTQDYKENLPKIIHKLDENQKYELLKNFSLIHFIYEFFKSVNEKEMVQTMTNSLGINKTQALKISELILKSSNEQECKRKFYQIIKDDRQRDIIIKNMKDLSPNYKKNQANMMTLYEKNCKTILKSVQLQGVICNSLKEYQESEHYFDKQIQSVFDSYVTLSEKRNFCRKIQELSDSMLCCETPKEKRILLDMLKNFTGNITELIKIQIYSKMLNIETKEVDAVLMCMKSNNLKDLQQLKESLDQPYVLLNQKIVINDAFLSEILFKDLYLWLNTALSGRNDANFIKDIENEIYSINCKIGENLFWKFKELKVDKSKFWIKYLCNPIAQKMLKDFEDHNNKL